MKISNNISNIYFVGIGGIGMSALARYFNLNGYNVSGYDRTPTELTDKLKSEGINICFEDDTKNIPQNINAENTLIVYTPAIPKDNKILSFFKENNFTMKKRAEVLGLIFNEKQGLAIAGTHGKTSISTITAYLLYNAGESFSSFIGGISKNFNSNLILNKNSKYIVAEADEFDRSFLHLFPSTTLISSVDADHLDIYGEKDELKRNFELFASQTAENGNIIIKYGINIETPDNANVFTYSLNNKNADFYAENIHRESEKYVFDVVLPDNQRIENVTIGIPGLINVENAIAGISICVTNGIAPEKFVESLSDFAGVKRRFDYIIKSEDTVFIDDYAHHPEELKATISSVKELYPDKEITGIFQPHLYSRTRDFAEDFAKSLDLLDNIILLDIYPARELPIKGVSSKIIFDKMKNENKTLCSKNEITEHLKNTINNKTGNVILTLGAGDINKEINKIKNFLLDEVVKN